MVLSASINPIIWFAAMLRPNKRPALDANTAASLQPPAWAFNSQLQPLVEFWKLAASRLIRHDLIITRMKPNDSLRGCLVQISSSWQVLHRLKPPKTHPTDDLLVHEWLQLRRKDAAPAAAAATGLQSWRLKEREKTNMKRGKLFKHSRIFGVSSPGGIFGASLGRWSPRRSCLLLLSLKNKNNLNKK